MWKTWSRSSSVDEARPERRVVAGVDVGHRRSRSRRPGRKANDGSWRIVIPTTRHERQHDDLDDREVDRREAGPRRARPSRSKTSGPGGRAESARRASRGWRWRDPPDGQAAVGSAASARSRPARWRRPLARRRRGRAGGSRAPGRSRRSGRRGPRARPSSAAGPAVIPAVGELPRRRAGDGSSTAGGRRSCGRCRARPSAPGS